MELTLSETGIQLCPRICSFAEITRVGLDFVTIQNLTQQNRVTPSPFDFGLWTLNLDLDCDKKSKNNFGNLKTFYSHNFHKETMLLMMLPITLLSVSWIPNAEITALMIVMMKMMIKITLFRVSAVDEDSKIC